jgi:hypothetical protein
MRYLQTDVGHWPSKSLPWWCWILKIIIPAANPDLEKFYFQTRIWWLEIDDAGQPQREIGFDETGNPIVLGPIGRNFGFLVDSSDNWKYSTQDSEEARRDFQKKWEILWPKFKHLER